MRGSQRYPYIRGAAATAFGKLPGNDALSLQSEAARRALDDAELLPKEVDAVICGYATTNPHLMSAGLLAERLGLRPPVAFGTSAGGATGLIMVAQACELVRSGTAHNILVVAGENRATGRARQATTDILAQVGHPTYEVPLGATIPGYYALLASRYLWEHDLPDDALAGLAVQMRANAAMTDGAHFREAITIDDVMASRPVALPLHLLDCCPMSDGGAAVVVSSRSKGPRSVAVRGVGQANEHQHLCSMDPRRIGARVASHRALKTASMSMFDIDVFGIYDSFTITLAMILEDLELATAGHAGDEARRGAYAHDGRHPTNTHGGLLSYGHSGAAGGMTQLIEIVTQLRHEAGTRQIRRCARGYAHAEGGVLSAHVGVVVEVDT